MIAGQGFRSFRLSQIKRRKSWFHFFFTHSLLDTATSEQWGRSLGTHVSAYNQKNASIPETPCWIQRPYSNSRTGLRDACLRVQPSTTHNPEIKPNRYNNSLVIRCPGFPMITPAKGLALAFGLVRTTGISVSNRGLSYPPPPRTPAIRPHCFIELLAPLQSYPNSSSMEAVKQGKTRALAARCTDPASRPVLY